MNYKELKNRHQEEVNNFPLGFAFSNEQFREMMNKWGLTENDTDKIYSIGGGGFVQKKDSDAMDEMFTKHTKEMNDAMKDPRFAEDAFYYEMLNHEYPINLQKNFDVLGCFYDVEYHDDDYNEEHYFEELNLPTEIRLAYENAKVKCLKAFGYEI